jgi:hypothetical protein
MMKYIISTIAIYLVGTSVSYADTWTKLGSTEGEWCTSSSTVKIYDRYGNIWKVAKKGKTFIKTPQAIALHPDGLTWFCGGTREKTGVPKGANKIELEYHGDGRIWIRFFHDWTLPSYVEQTTDGCDATRSGKATFVNVFNQDFGIARSQGVRADQVDKVNQLGQTLQLKKDSYKNPNLLILGNDGFRWYCGTDDWTKPEGVNFNDETYNHVKLGLDTACTLAGVAAAGVSASKTQQILQKAQSRVINHKVAAQVGTAAVQGSRDQILSTYVSSYVNPFDPAGMVCSQVSALMTDIIQGIDGNWNKTRCEEGSSIARVYRKGNNFTTQCWHSGAQIKYTINLEGKDYCLADNNGLKLELCAKQQRQLWANIHKGRKKLWIEHDEGGVSYFTAFFEVRNLTSEKCINQSGGSGGPITYSCSGGGSNDRFSLRWNRLRVESSGKCLQANESSRGWSLSFATCNYSEGKQVFRSAFGCDMTHANGICASSSYMNCGDPKGCQHKEWKEDPNKYLSGKNYESAFNATVSECVRKCESLDKCKSVDYKKREQLCTMNTDRGGLSSSSNYTHWEKPK